MSSPLMRLKLAAASGSRGFRAAGEVGCEKRPALEGLRAGGTLSIPTRWSIFSIYGPKSRVTELSGLVVWRMPQIP